MGFLEFIKLARFAITRNNGAPSAKASGTRGLSGSPGLDVLRDRGVAPSGRC